MERRKKRILGEEIGVSGGCKTNRKVKKPGLYVIENNI